MTAAAAWCLAGCDLVFQVTVPGPSAAETCIVESDAFDTINPQFWTVIDPASGAVTVTADAGSLRFDLSPDVLGVYNGLTNIGMFETATTGVVLEVVQPPQSNGFSELVVSLGVYAAGVYRRSDASYLWLAGEADD